MYQSHLQSQSRLSSNSDGLLPVAIFSGLFSHKIEKIFVLHQQFNFTIPHARKEI